MQYRKYGNTDILVSALGFGTMRLPEYENEGNMYVDKEQTKNLLTFAYEKGINYFDCGFGYLHENCEDAVGDALMPFRKDVYISTKLPVWKVKCADDFDKIIETQLKRLKTDYIDFYHFHAVNKNYWENTILKFNLIEKMQKYKENGTIRFISFSYHDDIKTMKEMIDTDVFSTCLCQYNLIDRSYEEGISYASKKGMGVAIMGPIGGGRLEKGNEQLNKFLKNQNETLPHLAIKFVLSNPNVSTVLSGMSNLEMLKDNINTVENFKPLTKSELEQLNNTSEELEKMSQLYCTGCKYCLPCTQNINIPSIFNIMNQHLVYGLTDSAKNQYQAITRNNEADASACIKCGKCLKKCPQKIEIIKRLAEIDLALK